MSSAGRGPRGGDGADYFTTPSYAVRRLLERWAPQRSGGVWAEPGCGNGAIIRSVDGADAICAARGIVRPSAWRAFELREEERAGLELLVGSGNVRIGNFLHLDLSHVDPEVTVVLGNPPYSHAFAFLMQCHLLFPDAEIVLLLRQAFTTSQDRYPFMRVHVPDKYESPDRIDFMGAGAGDSADHAWMRWPAGEAWQREQGTVCLLNQTPKRERDLDRGHDVTPVDPQVSLFA